jgi:tRNA pseudouridine38-40 synthase
MVVAYDGREFRGFAPQPGLPTVAGALGIFLETVIGRAVPVVCAGRTDAGVHARGQVIHVDAGAGRLPADPAEAARRLQGAAARLLPDSVEVRRVELAPDGFHARHSARSRTYRYLLCDRGLEGPFLAGQVWAVPGPLDLEAMGRAADALVGEHDFSAFCRAGQLGPVREVIACSLRPVRLATAFGDGLWLEITARSFCQQMVRSIVGTLVAIGRGRLATAAIGELLSRADRSLTPAPAPPDGLYLWSVGYEDGFA